MTEQSKPTITREERIVVAQATKNQFGDLVVIDKNGKTYKVGKKRERLFALFQPGSEVALAYATYMNKEYIADAVLIVATVIAPKDTPKPEPVKTPGRTHDDKNVAFALSYSKDIAVAGLIPKEEILTWAEVFKRYLNGDLGVDDTKVIKALFGEKVVKK